MVGELPLPLLHPFLPCSTIPVILVFLCIFILLLPSVSPLSMSQSSLPLTVIGVTVGKSVFAQTLLQVGRILSLIFAPRPCSSTCPCPLLVQPPSHPRICLHS